MDLELQGSCGEKMLRKWEGKFWGTTPGLDTDIVVHRLPTREDCPPIKQKVHRMRPDMSEKIKAEVMKQFNAGFLVVTTYPQWVANIVLVPKKDGKVRMCMDYRDLNRASPKGDFPLPHIDILVDNTAQHKVFSFMDGFSGYNQIKMALEIGRASCRERV